MSDSKARETLYKEIRKLSTTVADATAAAVATGSMPNTTHTIAVYDDEGNILGYVPLYANADLS